MSRKTGTHVATRFMRLTFYRDGRSILGERMNDRADTPTAAAAPPPEPESPRVPNSHRRHIAILAAATLAVVTVDLVTKAAAVEALAAGPMHVGIFHLRLVANRGILMGMLAAPVVLVFAATLAVVVVAIRATRTSGAFVSIAFGLMAGGALGNLMDRFVERRGFPTNAVVDWLSFGGMTFNLADVALLIGVVMLLMAKGQARDPVA